MTLICDSLLISHSRSLGRREHSCLTRLYWRPYQELLFSSARFIEWRQVFIMLVTQVWLMGRVLSSIIYGTVNQTARGYVLFITSRIRTQGSPVSSEKQGITLQWLFLLLLRARLTFSLLLSLSLSHQQPHCEALECMKDGVCSRHPPVARGR